MDNIELRMEKTIEILTIKKQEIWNAKMAVNRKTVWSDTERYKLNMEMLTWIVNTDSLLLKFSKNHREDKQKFKMSKGAEGNKEQGILFGLYYAFNCFKHNMKILSMETVNDEKLFEIEDIKYSVLKNEWSKSVELVNRKYEQEHNFYMEYLRGKNVGEIFDKAIFYLVQQYNLAK